jgi:hypothetical protein
LIWFLFHLIRWNIVAMDYGFVSIGRMSRIHGVLLRTMMFGGSTVRSKVEPLRGRQESYESHSFGEGWFHL